MGTAKDKIQQLATFIKKNPDDSFSKFALALEFLKEDQLKKARILFEDIQQKDPGYDGVYYHLGKLYEATDQQDKALKTYKKGISIAGENKHQRNVSELKEAFEELKYELENED